ncbi:hypothetical protein FHG87_013386 [Trinorchestia longiramus]|nr:hypothetical protein FHG87_013386 [Trinorchestia longiramus]
MNISMKSLKFSRARFNSNSSEQQRFQGFGGKLMIIYAVTAKKALEILIPFVTTYLCEQSFSRMLDIKTKKRNRLCCENMRVVLAKVKPRISELASERQQQKSH